MDTKPAFGFTEMMTAMVGDMTKALSERDGESKQQRFDRSRAAVEMILSLRPRDAIEAMLAGHCVMFHAVMVDSVGQTLRGEADTTRRVTRSNLVALNKSFAGNLTLLEHYRLRPSQGTRDAVPGPAAEAGVRADPAAHSEPVRTPTLEVGVSPTPAAQPARAEPEPTEVPAPPPLTVPRPLAMPAPTAADPAITPPPLTVARPLAPSAADRPAAVSAIPPAPLPVSRPVAPGMMPATDIAASGRSPSLNALAAFHTSPEAAAALEAGDPMGFARAMGIEPSEAFLAAARAPGSPFDPAASGPWLTEVTPGRSKV